MQLHMEMDDIFIMILIFLVSEFRRQEVRCLSKRCIAEMGHCAIL